MASLARVAHYNRTEFCRLVHEHVNNLRAHMNRFPEYPNFDGMQRHDLEQARTMLTEMLEKENA